MRTSFSLALFVGCFVAVALMVGPVVWRSTPDSPQVEVPDKPKRKSSDATFPQVYEAVVPCPGMIHDDTPSFQARVDFLGLLESGLSSPIDGLGSDYCRIQFLVHSQLQLDQLYVETLEPSLSEARSVPTQYVSSFHANPEATSKLLGQTEDESPYESRQQSNFDTIRGYDCYKSVDGMNDWMDNVVSRASSIPELSATKPQIGSSHLGEAIYALHLTGAAISGAQKSPMFIMTGIHAREYAPPELAARWVDFLVENNGNDADVTSILEHTDIHIVFEVNPDGRRIAETNRFAYQRKNRNDEECPGNSGGVDLNRNFGFKWGLSSGSSSNPCDDTYRGKAPNSEPETQAITNYIDQIFPVEQRISDPFQGYPEHTTKGIFFDIHSYGELIIWPWGHEELETSNDEGFETLANKYRHFNQYAFSGPDTPEFLYPASGATDDYAYGKLGASAMTFELGERFYERCNNFENDVVKNIPALTYAAKVAKAPFSIPKGPDVEEINASVVSNRLEITAKASDSSFQPNGNEYSTESQRIEAITVFIDEHPYDTVSLGTDMEGVRGTSTTTTGTLSVNLNVLAAGRHTVYVQATDSDGYTGPVTATYFFVQEGTDQDDDDVCRDSAQTFEVPRFEMTRGCGWLAYNLGRFGYLCNYLSIAEKCRSTCEVCPYFE